MNAAFAAAAASLLVGTAARAATDYVAIRLETHVAAPPEQAWPRIKGFCQVGAWVKTTCVIISGQDGEPGAVRRLAGRVDEVLVASTAWSYTYIQPKSPVDYHGTVEIRPDGAGGSKLTYTLLYDQAALPAAVNRTANQDHRRQQFGRILAAMKSTAEAGDPR